MTIRRQGSTNNLGGSAIQGGSVQGWTAAQNNVARQLMMYYMAGGWSKAGAAGMIGNQMQESSLNPSEAGGYLSQWGGSRLANLQTFAASHGLPVTSVEAQAKFTLAEMKTGYPQLDSFLQTTTDPAVAAVSISNQYERPLASAANNSGRAQYAQQAFGGVTAAQGIAPDGSGQGSSAPSGAGSSAPTSVLGLLTSPVSGIGGWLASIAVTVVKDTAIGIGDYIVLPFLHWQERSVMSYYTEMFGKSAWPMIPWNAAFWGLGYWLLFTDPSQGLFNLKPAPARRSRVAHHVRTAQSIPARRELIRPEHIVKRTPKKPKPVSSTATVHYIRSMGTERRQPVRITGDTIDEKVVQNGGRDSNTKASGIPPRRTASARTLANAGNRARRGSLPNRGGTSNRRPEESGKRGGNS